MELDTKQKVLLAVYMEYQKDIPNMVERLWPPEEKLGLQDDVVVKALLKLYNEGYTTDPGIRADVVSLDVLEDMMMTRDGIDYVENKFGIERSLTSKEKIENVVSKTAEWGFEQLKEIGVKVLAEIAKAQMGI